MKNETIITAIVRNKTYAHSGSPEEARVNLDGRLSPQGFPLTRTNRMSVPSSIPKPNPQTGELETRNNSVPFIPENTVRNRLRNLILSTMFDQLHATSRAIQLSCFATLQAGSATGNPDGIPATFDEMHRLGQHFFIGLFGGGPRMLKGKLKCDGFIPLIPSAARILPPGYEDRFTNDRITQIRFKRRVDPVTKVDEEECAIIKDASDAITAWGLDKAEKKLASKSKSDESTETEIKTSRNLDSFTAIELIIPGVDFLSRVRLVSPTDAQIGAILQAYEKVSTITFGGGHGLGYGEFELQELTLNGDSVFEFGGLTKAAQPYLDAFWDEVAELDVETLEAYAASNKK